MPSNEYSCDLGTQIAPGPVQPHNPMISHVQMQQDRSVPGRSTFNVQGLPQKNAKHAKNAAGIALPGSLSSLTSARLRRERSVERSVEPRSFAAIVSPVAQIFNLSVSVQIVASRDDFAERGSVSRSTSALAALTEISQV